MDPSPAPPTLRILDGECVLYFAYDIGLATDLNVLQQLVSAGGRRQVLPHRRRAPEHFGYHTPPVRVTETGAPIQLGRFATASQVDCVVFEFGAVSVVYTVPLASPDGTPATLNDLLDLSDLLYENPSLLADSRRRVEGLLENIRAAIKKPVIAPIVEDYAVFHLRKLDGVDPANIGPAILGHGERIARILRSERSSLSTQETDDALACRISYSPDDLTIIDWNGAIVAGPDMTDVLAVLEYANVELLEMRYLDGDLDRALERARITQPSTGLRRLFRLGPDVGGDAAVRFIAELQVDAARLFEEVNNALKLLGDQYLARVYRLASGRLHLPEWDTSILRKLDTIESIYQKMSDYQTTRRLELLEWIVIILIAFEIIMSFVRH